MNALNVAAARWGMSAPITAESIMPPSKADLDKELADFLRGQREAEADGVSVRTLHRALKTLDGRIADHDKEDRDRHNEAMQAIYGLQGRMSSAEAEARAVKSDVDELKPAVRDTADSIHDITEQDLADRLAEEKAAHNRKIDVLWKIGLIVIGAVASALIGYACARLGLK